MEVRDLVCLAILTFCVTNIYCNDCESITTCNKCIWADCDWCYKMDDGGELNHVKANAMN